jgi:ankyrin repeat protein
MDDDDHELFAQYKFERSQGRDEWYLDKIQARLDGKGFAVAETQTGYSLIERADVALANKAMEEQLKNQWSTPEDMAQLVRKFAKKDQLPDICRLVFVAIHRLQVDPKTFINIGNINRKTPIHFASQHGGPNMVRFLLRHGANPNDLAIRGQSALCFAIAKRRYKNVEVLLEAGAHVNVITVLGETPAMLARAHIELHREDLKKRIEDLALSLADVPPVTDYTSNEEAIVDQLLHAQTCVNCQAVARALIKGEKVDIRNFYKNNPPKHHTLVDDSSCGNDNENASKIRNAASRADPSLLSDLLDLPGSDVESLSRAGRSALMLASWRGCVENVKILIQRGADVDYYTKKSGNYGKTPIFYAITRCRDDVVCTLIAAGARLTIVNNKGQTPMSLAASHLQPATIELMKRVERQQLLEAMAKGLPLWMNYRDSHSDGIAYGDLDVRFLDEDNMAGRAGRYPAVDPEHLNLSGGVCVNATDQTNRGREKRVDLIAEDQTFSSDNWWPRALGQHSFVEKTVGAAVLPWVERWASEEKQRLEDAKNIPMITLSTEEAICRPLKAILEEDILPHLSDVSPPLDVLANTVALELLLRVIRTKKSSVPSRECYDKMESEFTEGFAFLFQQFPQHSLMLLALSLSPERIEKQFEAYLEEDAKACRKSNTSERYGRRIVKATEKGAVKVIQMALSSNTRPLLLFPWSSAENSIALRVVEWGIASYRCQLSKQEAGAAAFPGQWWESAPEFVGCYARQLITESTSSAKGKSDKAFRDPKVSSTTPPNVAIDEWLCLSSELHGAVSKARATAEWAAVTTFYKEQRSENWSEYSYIKGRLPPSRIHWVSSSDDVQSVRRSLEASLDSDCGKENMLLIGIDTEWGDDKPGCSVIQIGSLNDAWVVDCAEAFLEVSGLLEWIFVDERFVKVGYSFHNDWPQLEMLFPGLQERASTVYDLQPVLSNEMAVHGYVKNPGASMVGLSSAVKFMFGKPMDKTQQCSDWNQRPLSSEQIEYAAFDAVILVDLVLFLGQTSAVSPSAV